MSSTQVPTTTTTDATHLWLTDDEQHCALLAQDPAAFVIGFILDQQVTVQKAFRGPADLLERIGTLEPAAIADMPLEELTEAFQFKPALHRFPVAMARRVHAAMRIITDMYGGNAARIWWEADGLEDLEHRLMQLPGFGGAKITSIIALLARQCGVPITGWEDRIPEFGTLGDVDSPEALAAYQARKRAVKAAARAAAAASGD
ncbi:MAG: HhH-GPD-type base excision DNA repair protein [Gaiellales bacterium]